VTWLSPRVGHENVYRLRRASYISLDGRSAGRTATKPPSAEHFRGAL
jgi:hypothetical protein